MAKDSGRNSSGVVVIGLGRFGTALALELVEQDIEVLGKLSIYLLALLSGIAGSAGGDNY